MQRLGYRAAHLAATISPQHHISSQQPHQPAQIPFAHSASELFDDLATGLWRWHEAGPMFSDMFLCPAERLSTGHLVFVEDGSDLSVAVVDNFVQQEDRPLLGCESA